MDSTFKLEGRQLRLSKERESNKAQFQDAVKNLAAKGSSKGLAIEKKFSSSNAISITSGASSSSGDQAKSQVKDNSNKDEKNGVQK